MARIFLSLIRVIRVIRGLKIPLRLAFYGEFVIHWKLYFGS
jgi:hypothetical protein